MTGTRGTGTQGQSGVAGTTALVTDIDRRNLALVSFLEHTRCEDLLGSTIGDYLAFVQKNNSAAAWRQKVCFMGYH